ncbi:hypothetical protein ABW636_06270 [Aquimarina sp. 2201CG1-2-11]|uniref:hypothetical protein n=1 Tax=Aquimarina discodermiae TaxID=3231043 RepID=UPI0034617D3E
MKLEMRKSSAMNKFILSLVVVCFFKVSYALEEKNSVGSRNRAILIKNTIEQLDYLVKHNSKEHAKTLKKSDQWYIYIAGGTLDSLKYYMDKTNGKETRVEFLNNLNKSLIELNAESSTAVYVAFTDYEHKILTPVFPPDRNTLTKREAYVNELINKKKFDELIENELNTYLTFSEAFRD